MLNNMKSNDGKTVVLLSLLKRADGCCESVQIEDMNYILELSLVNDMVRFIPF